MSDKPQPEEEFQDPLANYDPKKYADRLEQALSEETVATVEHVPYEVIAPETTVADAVKKLAGLHIACLLVEKDGDLLGVFSDRDVLKKVALEYDQVASKPVSEVMTDDPIYVYETDSAAAALAVMVVAGYRHVPVLNVRNKLIGIVSPQRVTSFLQKYA
ncbi:MAG: CBS domain-containing protein [Planctomycetota bacterium]|nr:MAG: CBS domain-containing protein [Planctomycetota bacterium]